MLLTIDMRDLIGNSYNPSRSLSAANYVCRRILAYHIAAIYLPEASSAAHRKNLKPDFASRITNQTRIR